MGDPTKLRLGPAVVTYNGVDIGYTALETPIEIDDTPKEVEVFAAQEGETPVDAILTGHTCTVTVASVEVTPEKLALAIPNAVQVGGRVAIKNLVGQSLRALAHPLKITRLVAGAPSTDPDDILTFYACSPMAGPVKQSFNAKKQQELTIKFRAWKDPDSGEFYFVGA